MPKNKTQYAKFNNKKLSNLCTQNVNLILEVNNLHTNTSSLQITGRSQKRIQQYSRKNKTKKE